MKPVGRLNRVTKSELWSVPLRRGEPRSLGFSVSQNVQSLSIHPDGSRIAFHVWEQSTEAWTMENFLTASTELHGGDGK